MNVRDLIPWNRTSDRGMMTPRGMDDSSPLMSLQRDMNRMFDDFFRGFDLPQVFGRQSWPNIDVAETDTEYKVTAELPGLEEKDVELTLRDNTLMISGEKRDEREEKNEGRYYAERFVGRFSRTVPLPDEVDPDKVAAAFKNGVLTVVMPKSQTARESAKRIPIQKLS
jgi:HSP20 family protein